MGTTSDLETTERIEGWAAQVASKPWRPLGGALAIVLFFLAFLAGAELGHWLSAEPGHFATFWPNSGLYLAVLLRVPFGRWWVVGLIGVGANLTSDVLLHGQRPAVGVGFATANVVEAMVGAAVVRWWRGDFLRLDRLDNLLSLCGVAALLSTPLGAAIGSAVVTKAFGASFLVTWQVWWVADALGVLLMAPLVLAMFDAREWPQPARFAEGVALLAGLWVASIFTFTMTPPTAPIILLLFLLWAAIRLGVLGVAVSAFVLAVLAVRYTISGHGLYAVTEDALARVVAVQLYVGVASLLAYAFSCLLEERRQAEAKLETRVRHRTAELLAQRELLQVTLMSIGDGVITTDTEGRIVSLNAVAESLTGWKNEEAVEQPLENIFRIVNEQTRQPVENPVKQALREGVIVGLANHTLLLARDGTERAIDDSAAPIRSREGQLVGCVLVFRDISERNRTEGMLRRREQELADFFENATLGLHWVGPDGIILRANRAELNMLGYSCEEYIGHPIAEFHADEEAIRDILRRLQAGEELHDYEARLRCKDGSIRQVLIDSSVMWEEGRFVHTRCFTRDITDRNRMQETERRLAALVDSSADAIVSKSLDGIIQSWNAAAERLFGYNAEQAVGRHISLLIPADRMDEEDGILARLRAGERVEPFDTVRLRRDGQPIHVSLTISPVRDAEGRVVGASKIARDITEQIRLQNFERESQRKLRFVMDSMPQKIFTARPNGEVDYFNPIWMEFTGLSFEQIRDWGWTQFIHADDVAENVRAWQDSIATGQPFQFEHRFRRRDGEYRWHMSRAVPMRDAEGRIGMWIGSNTDIHEVKESDRRKDEFLATLAHELRNPLAPISHSLPLLRESRAAPEVHEETVKLLERQVEHMVRLVDDLLEISRVTRGKIELRRRPITLAEIVHRAVESARPVVEASGHRLTIELPAGSVSIDGDLVRLAQVVANLLNNSAKYTEAGGRIWLTGRCEGNQVMLSVRDTGVGIPAEMLPRVFELFTQVEHTRGRSQGGMGIGLALVRSLVQMHGGDVEARSEGPGRESEFVVRLPVVEEIAQSTVEKKLEPPRPTASLSGRRVLVVDDNRDAANSLGKLLRAHRAEVQVAYDGASALEAINDFRPDAVLLDIGMPGMDGYEVAERIRREGRFGGITLIALTGWGQETDRQRSREAGFDAHLVKPVDLQVLRQRLAEGTASESS